MVHDDLNGGELVGPFASIVTEDKHTGAVLDIIRGVSVGGDNVVGDDVAVVVERGHSGRAGTSVGVGAEWEDCDCDPFRRTLRICVRDIQSASETCVFDYHMQDTVALGIALHHDQLLRRAYRLCSISGGSCSYCALLDPARLCISNTCAQGMRSSLHFGDLSCRMLCIVVSDIAPRCGHVLGNVRTLRR